MGLSESLCVSVGWESVFVHSKEGGEIPGRRPHYEPCCLPPSALKDRANAAERANVVWFLPTSLSHAFLSASSGGGVVSFLQ